MPLRTRVRVCTCALRSRARLRLTPPPHRANAAEGGDGMDESASALAATAAVCDADRQWYSGPPFVKEGVSIPMCFRLATEADVKPDGKAQSRWLWRGGAPPKPPGRRGRAQQTGGNRPPKAPGKRRRRGRGGGADGADGDDAYGEDEEGAMDFDVEKPSGDLREALKKRREEAPTAEGAADGAAPDAAAEGGAAGAAEAMDGEGAAAAAAVDDAPPAELPPNDLRTTVLASVVPDFGNDLE
jgi:hypothetical protein